MGATTRLAPQRASRGLLQGGGQLVICLELIDEDDVGSNKLLRLALEAFELLEVVLVQVGDLIERHVSGNPVGICARCSVGVVVIDNIGEQ